MWRLACLLTLPALAACGERLGASPREPITFVGSDVEHVARDIVDIRVNSAHPSDFASAAYADCVAAGYALKTGYSHVSRLSVGPRGNGDFVGEKTRYLLSTVAPGGRKVLNAGQIARHCRANKFPTE